MRKYLLKIVLCSAIIGLIFTGCTEKSIDTMNSVAATASPTPAAQISDTVPHLSLMHPRPYRVLSEGNLANEDTSRSVGLWFIISEEASGFDEYAQTAVQAVLDLYRLYGRDYTSVHLLPSDKLEYAGLSYAQANFAADGRGAAGMTGDAPAKEGYWKVRAADRKLNEQELAIAELWQAKQQDFPQKNPWSSLSYDEEALRHYIADTLSISYNEAQKSDLEMREYELDQSFIDWTMTLAVKHIPALSLDDQAAIYAEVIRRLATVDDSFGGSLKPPMIYIIKNTDDKAGNPTGPGSFSRTIPQSSRDIITDMLQDLSTKIIWIDKFEDAEFEGSRAPGPQQAPERVKDGGAIITLGNISLQQNRSVQIAGSIWVGNLGAGGTTYILEKKDGVWEITGTTNVRWMS